MVGPEVLRDLFRVYKFEKEKLAYKFNSMT